MSYRIPAREIEVFLRRQDDSSVWKPDAVVSSSVDRRLSVTDHPVEQGQSVTDHVQVQPRTIMLTAVVSELPRRGNGGPVRVRDRLKWLEETGGTGRRVDIITRRHGVFLGYVLSGIKFEIGNVSALTFDLELREVRIASVSSISISVDQVSSDVASGAPSAVDLGEQSTTSTTATAATEQEAERDQSMLAALVDAL